MKGKIVNNSPYSKPLVDLDLTPKVVDNVVAETLTVTAPFMSPKVRARIYSIAGALGVICMAAAPLVGGVIGDALGLIGAAATAASSVTALSHISS